MWAGPHAVSPRVLMPGGRLCVQAAPAAAPAARQTHVGAWDRPASPWRHQLRVSSQARAQPRRRRRSTSRGSQARGTHPGIGRLLAAGCSGTAVEVELVQQRAAPSRQLLQACPAARRPLCSSGRPRQMQAQPRAAPTLPEPSPLHHTLRLETQQTWSVQHHTRQRGTAAIRVLTERHASRTAPASAHQRLTPRMRPADSESPLAGAPACDSALAAAASAAA
jgi:hypothetical protein